MKEKLFATNNEWASLVIRLSIGLILFPHGAQKMLGIFGGYGFTGTMDFFTGTLHIPWILGFLVIAIEFFGALFLIAGFAVRIWSACILILFTCIIFFSHWENGFFMNWFGNQNGEGFEFHLLVIGLSVAAILNGAGKFSIDRRILS